MKKLSAAIALASVAALSGCASAIHGTNTDVDVGVPETGQAERFEIHDSEGEKIGEATAPGKINLKNGRITPAKYTLHPLNEELQPTEVEGGWRGTIAVNGIMGPPGLIGAGVDAWSGGGHKLPNVVHIKKVDESEEK